MADGGPHAAPEATSGGLKSAATKQSLREASGAQYNNVRRNQQVTGVKPATTTAKNESNAKKKTARRERGLSCEIQL